MHYDHYISTMLALSIGFASASPALAQDDKPVQQPDDDQIVVTATRGGARADSIAARTDVVTRDDIERKGYVTAVDALKAIPGLSVVQSGGAGTLTSVFARGTNSKHTLALYDGIRLNDASSPNGQFNFGSDALGDLERIEVLRGPASAVYGSDAVGGVINFIPRVGGERAFMPYGEVSGGNLDTYHVLGGARGSAGPVHYSLTGEYFETGGFNNTASRIADDLGERDGSRFFSASGNVALDVADGLTLRGLARYRKAKADYDDAALDRAGRGGRDRYFIWRVAPRYVALDGRYQGDLEFGQVDNKRSEWNHPDANNSFGGPDTSATGLRTFAAWRNRFEFKPVEAVKATVSAGIEWQKDKVTAFDGYSDPLARAEKQTALYGLAQASIADRVDLSGSVRHDDPEFFKAVTTWNAGAVLRLPEIGGRVYVAYGTSFKAPALAERYTTSAYNVANPLLRPEHGKSFEAGLDAGSRIGAIGWASVSATYFDTKINDLIEYDSATLTNLNVGRAKIDGYELSFKARAGTIADLAVNYTRTNAYNGATGEQLLRRPKNAWSANLTVTPITPLSLTGEYLRRGVREDVVYEPTSPWGPGGNYLGNGTVPDYDIVNFSVRYKLIDAVELFANLRNAFDAKYEEPNSYASAPRTWLIGTRARF
ncbi:TonB-dependent receptor [Sphingomonas sp. dw_22]|uniref:TonB-dependent receptor domain-containing protein n=1 Tax=Sphingomonas sp. dw_22 TaxID=2721175 RepID=UPI001BD5D1A2|nr:TonB-dependent receptor [Sphingomonas sp. dw_22]